MAPAASTMMDFLWMYVYTYIEENLSAMIAPSKQKICFYCQQLITNSMSYSSYMNGTFTDLTIKFKDKTYNVHKVVVCNQSSVLRAMCTGPFKEGKDSTIILDNDPDLDEAQLNCLMCFLYKFEYSSFETVARCTSGTTPGRSQPADTEKFLKILPWNPSSAVQAAPPFPDAPVPPPPCSSPPGGLSPNFHAKMYALADKYDIRELSEFSKEMYGRSLLPKLRNLPRFLDSVVTVYTTTPESDRGLKDIAAEYAKRNIAKLDQDALQDVILEVPMFAVDVFGLFHVGM